MSTATKKAIAEYKRLVAAQDAMPSDTAWTLGGQVKLAKAKVYVENGTRYLGASLMDPDVNLQVQRAFCQDICDIFENAPAELS